jgi:large subunit ribosomal protein L22
MITARLNEYRQSPRKVRLVATLMKGKRALDAISLLNVTIKEASGPLKKLVEAAISDAKNNFNIGSENLFIKEFRVDAGTTMKRSMPRARGSAFPIKKRTSHITLVLEERVGKGEKGATKKALEASVGEASAKTAKKAVKKTATK